MEKIQRNVEAAKRFVRRQAKKIFVSAVMFSASAVPALAQGVAGFTKATNEFKSYMGPVQKLLYAIAAIIALVGAFSIYFKMQNGDQDVKKSIMMTVGGCVAFIAMATALPAFFQ
ncbi:MAG: DUF4134 domain-containing protein [Bacteroidaceae bacterium]|nr:DUF4134 domain-containing protein [Prevotellaceae bacterium]MDY5630906.1 DUF4134 domain-containing protein [Bacteroidaceae bacterium]